MSESNIAGLSKRKLLVVGSGFIAAQLALTAAARWGWGVEVIYQNYQNPALCHLPTHRLPESVTELCRLIENAAPTDIVIALGSSFVPDINRDLDQALTQHLDGPLRLLDAVSRLQQGLAGKILMIGSASEYGEFDDTPVGENHATKPRDHYGHIKLTLRHLGLYYHRHHGLPVVHIRQFNVTGAAQDPRFVLPSICRQIAQVAKHATEGDDQSIVAGNTAVCRDFLSVDDVCEAYRTLMQSGVAGDVYNVCSGKAYRIEELISMAADIAGVNIKVEVSPQLLRENDRVQTVICGDPSKLEGLGWTPKVQMRELLAQMIEKFSSADSSEQTSAKKH
jgi:GDP-4-dehydro-6-deoxy-D-mannose reductase